MFVRDAKSSSGTFLNEVRLSPRGLESGEVEVRSGDMIRLGDDCELNGGK
jgi:pSer/pThr/pTyr-binding forkhead associated (FHA) protein